MSSLNNNDNPLVYMCYKLIMEGAVSNSLSFICHVYQCNRHVLATKNIVSTKNIVKSLVIDCEEVIKSRVIRDGLNMKHCLFNSESFFNDEELRLLLHDLCTCWLRCPQCKYVCLYGQNAFSLSNRIFVICVFLCTFVRNKIHNN